MLEQKEQGGWGVGGDRSESWQLCLLEGFVKILTLAGMQ